MNLPKARKNVKGMTLVEVVIAMAIFSVQTLAICMAFAAIMKYNARNQLRDKELSHQQASVERKAAAGVALVSRTSFEGGELVFKNNSTVIKTVPNITEYKALKTAYKGNDYNFEIKSLSSTGLEPMPLISDKEKNRYKINIVNESGVSADVQLECVSGMIYEGDLDGVCYKHSSPIYMRTLDPLSQAASDAGETAVPSQMIVGFANPDLSDLSASQMTIRITGDGILYSTALMSAEISAAPNGSAEIVINPDKSVTLSYQ